MRKVSLINHHMLQIHKINYSFILTVLIFFIATTVYSKGSELDVLNYNLSIEPDIQNESVEGSVIITFQIDADENTIELNAGNLHIDQVTGKYVEGYKRKDDMLTINLSAKWQTTYKITISYHGEPKRGLLFNPELNQAHTVYFTNQWMVCNDKPSDKATFNLNIIVPRGKQCIASGELIGIDQEDDKNIFHWSQTYESPFYTYGFVIGDFNQVIDKTDNVILNYYSAQLSADKLKKVFVETGNILQFFEQKSGVKYIQNSYSQILIGNHYQEMSGLCVLSESYASSVLKDSSEIHLTSHELAHQWWGNMITCKTFSHFWLNEAFAVYMASAYSEYKFGKEKYLADIAIYKSIYDKLVEKEKDRPLIFTNWESSKDNRNVVYYKGAYVLHLLRQKLGDKAFWEGIKSYSQKYFGKSVETINFKQSMEESTNINLDNFFNTWIY